MKKSRYTETQIIRVLKEVEGGRNHDPGQGAAYFPCQVMAD